MTIDKKEYGFRVRKSYKKHINDSLPRKRLLPGWGGPSLRHESRVYTGEKLE
jgi:hypothetical protein